MESGHNLALSSQVWAMHSNTVLPLDRFKCQQHHPTNHSASKTCPMLMRHSTHGNGNALHHPVASTPDLAVSTFGYTSSCRCTPSSSLLTNTMVAKAPVTSQTTQSLLRWQAKLQGNSAGQTMSVHPVCMRLCSCKDKCTVKIQPITQHQVPRSTHQGNTNANNPATCKQSHQYIRLLATA